MPGLTVTEKEHWKNRIARRIDKQIEALKATEPNFLDRIEREARQSALESLGLSDMQAELDQIAQQRQSLADRERQVQREILAKVRRVPVDRIDNFYGLAKEMDDAIKCRQAIHSDELLAASELGRRILGLRAEREGLLDSVWLAVSPKQIKELWTQVAELLGDNQTQLQRNALAIEPVTE